MTKEKVKSTDDIKTKIANICAWLDEKKARDLVAMDVQGKSNIADGIIVAGATSLRHGQGLADHVLENGKERNYEFLHMEGYKNGSWILLDFNDVLVNILLPEQRELYRLEELFPSAKKIELPG